MGRRRLPPPQRPARALRLLLFPLLLVGGGWRQASDADALETVGVQAPRYAAARSRVDRGPTTTQATASLDPVAAGSEEARGAAAPATGLEELSRDTELLREGEPEADAPAPLMNPAPEDPGPGAEYIERYEGRSGRLSPHATVDGAVVVNEHDSYVGQPLLTAWTHGFRQAYGDRALVRASLIDAEGAPVHADTVEVRFWHTSRGDGPVLPMVVVDGPGHGYEAALRLTGGAYASGSDGPREVLFSVVARGELEGAPFEREAVGHFFVHDPGARLVAADARAGIRAGNLEVVVELEVRRTGNYWIYGELWGGDDGREPLAFARDRLERLVPGTTSVALRFGGAILRDRAIDGPYVVRNLKVMQVDSIPPQEDAVVPVLLTTPAWPASAFH